MSLVIPLNVVVVDLEVLGMREFIDSLDGCTVGLPAFDYWHEPQTRVYNGVEVKGRETRGYGDHSFRYAGKKMHPSPWESNERQNNCAYSFDCYFVSIVFSNNNDASSNTAS